MIDNFIYNSSICREVNFKLFEYNGLIKDPKLFKNIKCLFAIDKGQIENQIKLKKQILPIVVNNNFPLSKILFEALGNRMRMIIILRHPTYLVDYWINKLKHFGLNSDDLILEKSKSQSKLNSLHDIKVNLTNISKADRDIYKINFLSKKYSESDLINHDQFRNRIIFVPYESFIFDPHSWMDKISLFLDTKKVRRNIIRRVKNEFDNNIVLSKNFYDSKLEAIEKVASKDAFDLIRNISKKYEMKYKLGDILN